jgi:hypothetical protein
LLVWDLGTVMNKKNILKIAGDLNSTLKIDRKKPKKENYKKVVSELI